jgi:hypothetical protein
MHEIGAAVNQNNYYHLFISSCAAEQPEIPMPGTVLEFGLWKNPPKIGSGRTRLKAVRKAG